MLVFLLCILLLKIIMAADLIEQCSKWTLFNEEEDDLELQDNLDEQQDAKLSLWLVGRLLFEKPLNFDALKRTLLHIWSLKEGVVIRAMESNMFVFQIFHWQDCEKVLNGRPWCFEQKLLVLQEIEKDVQPSKVILKSSPFWISTISFLAANRMRGLDLLQVQWKMLWK